MPRMPIKTMNTRMTAVATLFINVESRDDLYLDGNAHALVVYRNQGDVESLSELLRDALAILDELVTLQETREQTLYSSGTTG